jgi:type IV pilus assembly protein PilE
MKSNSTSRRANKTQEIGFTLVEVLIVVAVIGILSSIAIPSYMDYVTRGKIPDATSGLATKRTQIEQSFQDNRTYVGAPACANDTTTSRYFDFACTAATATTFTVRAQGKASMTGFTYTVNQTNTKATTASPAGWGTSVNCWVIRKGGAC